MPIHPDEWDRYPDDWPTISLRIRVDRAQGRCECAGECGRGPEHLDADQRCRNRQGMRAWRGSHLVILATAHLDHQPEHSDDDNLAALCQGCHLEHDRAHHVQTRKARRVAELGLVPLF